MSGFVIRSARCSTRTRARAVRGRVIIARTAKLETRIPDLEPKASRLRQTRHGAAVPGGWPLATERLRLRL